MGARNDDFENIVRELCTGSIRLGMEVIAEDDEEPKKKEWRHRWQGQWKDQIGNERCTGTTQCSNPSMGPITDAALCYS